MDANDVLAKIAYLDEGFFNPSSPPRSRELADIATSGDWLALMHAMVRHELSKEGHFLQAQELSRRVNALEQRIEVLQRPQVQYVVGFEHIQYAVVRTKKDVPAPDIRFPKAMILFYSLGLICSLAFAILITMSVLGTTLIHPLLSLLGLVGGLGWLTTAWTDLLLWKRERLGNRTTNKNGDRKTDVGEGKAIAITAQNEGLAASRRTRLV